MKDKQNRDGKVLCNGCTKYVNEQEIAQGEGHGDFEVYYCLDCKPPLGYDKADDWKNEDI